jgi:hypothetical protein
MAAPAAGQGGGGRARLLVRRQVGEGASWLRGGGGGRRAGELRRPQ